tara:strand:+ start:297 stop:854 length:558 start_codon:yes stop_codon:yes gene_type:complete
MTSLPDRFLESQRQILLSQRFDSEEYPEFWEWIAWENIIGGEEDDFLVDTSDFPIRSGRKHEFYEISNFEGFTEITEVTDEIRVSFARDVWSEALKELDGGSMPSSSFYSLTDSRHGSAGIGVLVWIYGQSGPHPENCGFFPSCDDFFQSLRERGFRDADDVKSLSDEEVLQIYMAAIDRVSGND